jgi:hypothetical protein
VTPESRVKLACAGHDQMVGKQPGGSTAALAKAIVAARTNYFCPWQTRERSEFGVAKALSGIASEARC